MKKFSFIIGCLFISLLGFPTNTYGNLSACKIKSGPAEALNEYIKNTRSAITNINQDLLIRSSEKSDSTLKNTGNKLNSMYNEMVNWDGFFTDFDYYIGFQLFNSLPSQIERDLALLENETEGLRRYLDTTISRGYGSISISKETVCNGVKNCNLEGSAKNIIGEMIKNNTGITSLYKQIVTNPDKKSSSYNTKIILSESSRNDFINSLITHYGGKTIEECAAPKGDDTFSARISKAIDGITLNNEQGKEGIKQWSQAWKMLIGGKVGGETYAEREERLLRNELSRQGLSLSSQEVMINNLREFNTDGFYSLDNNFIANSFESIYKGGEAIVDGFSAATSGLFGGETTAEINAEVSIGLETLLGETEKREIENQISSRLDILHRTHLEFAQVESVTNEKVVANIIKMHISLEGSKNKLQDTCELAVKVCNSQGKGKGNCGSCK